MKVLLIGNSFSRNATRYLPEMAADLGLPLCLGRAEVGGCSLQRHWEHVEAAQRGAPQGALYNSKTLRDLLSVEEWGVVVLQQASMQASDSTSFHPYSGQLIDYIKTFCPGAEMVLHQTWAYRCDSPFWSEIGAAKNACNQREMWQQTRDAYHLIARELGARVIPTGDAFWLADSDPQWKYRPDSQFDFGNPQFPALPNQTHSLHGGYYWNNEGQLSLDSKHTSEAGSYLGSLVWLGFLFNTSPQEVTFTPAGVTPEYAAHLRSVANKVVEQSAKAPSLSIPLSLSN